MSYVPYNRRHNFVDPDAEGLDHCSRCGEDRTEAGDMEACPLVFAPGDRVTIADSSRDRFGHDGVVTEQGTLVSVKFKPAMFRDGKTPLACHVYYRPDDLERINDSAQ